MSMRQLAEPEDAHVTIEQSVPGGSSGSPVVQRYPSAIVGVYVSDLGGVASKVVWLGDGGLDPLIAILAQDEQVEVEEVGPRELASYSFGLRFTGAAVLGSLSGEHPLQASGEFGTALWLTAMVHRFPRRVGPFDHLMLGANLGYRYGFVQERYRVVSREHDRPLEVDRDNYHAVTLMARLGLGSHYRSRISATLGGGFLLECVGGTCRGAPDGTSSTLGDRFGYATEARVRYALTRYLALTGALRLEWLPSRLSVIDRVPYATHEGRAIAAALEVGGEFDFLGHLRAR